MPNQFPKFSKTILVLICLISAARAFGEKKLSEDERIAIIRALGSEIYVSKIALPAGKNGIFLDATGNFADVKNAEEEYKKNGIAIVPGSLVQITAINFNGDDIRFEINYGGRKKGSWLQHVQVGVGTTTQPIAPPNKEVPRGSYITMKNVRGGTSPDDIKKILGTVIDFSRHSPTLLYSSSVPQKTKEAIEKREVIAGMDKDEVLSAKGIPDRKERETKEDGTKEETWIYGLPPHVFMVIFDEDEKVKSVKQY